MDYKIYRLLIALACMSFIGRMSLVSAVLVLARYRVQPKVHKMECPVEHELKSTLIHSMNLEDYFKNDISLRLEVSKIHGQATPTLHAVEVIVPNRYGAYCTLYAVDRSAVCKASRLVHDRETQLSHTKQSHC